MPSRVLYLAGKICTTKFSFHPRRSGIHVPLMERKNVLVFSKHVLTLFFQSFALPLSNDCCLHPQSWYFFPLPLLWTNLLQMHISRSRVRKRLLFSWPHVGQSIINSQNLKKICLNFRPTGGVILIRVLSCSQIRVAQKHIYSLSSSSSWIKAPNKKTFIRFRPPHLWALLRLHCFASCLPAYLSW